MRRLIILFVFLVPIMAYSQDWTPEEKEILERVKTGWTTWQEAVNTGDYSIWLDAVDPTDDWRCWWTENGFLWTTEDSKRNFDFLIKDIAKFQWIVVKPLEIQVHDNIAFIWFYASSAIENKSGHTQSVEEKRFEAYRKIDGKWRWSAGMVYEEPVDNYIE